MLFFLWYFNTVLTILAQPDSSFSSENLDLDSWSPSNIRLCIQWVGRWCMAKEFPSCSLYSSHCWPIWFLQQVCFIRTHPFATYLVLLAQYVALSRKNVPPDCMNALWWRFCTVKGGIEGKIDMRDNKQYDSSSHLGFLSCTSATHLRAEMDN